MGLTYLRLDHSKRLADTFNFLASSSDYELHSIIKSIISVSFNW